MSEQPAHYQNANATRDVIANVYALLEDLSDKRSIEPLKTLFWTELNYDQANMPLSRRQWPENSANLLAEDPLLFATGGENEDFVVIYARLASKNLRYGDERLIMNRLLSNHTDGLFVFSNQERDTWHFLNVKPDTTDTKRRLFRRITVGPEEHLRTASERIALLDLASLRHASLYDILERHEDAFDVEAVTDKFYRDYRTLFKILQIDLSKQTGDETWAHDYALQFLNRCMFLYFIQRKGWLGNDTNFLKTFWNSYRKGPHDKDTFFKEWLQVLFFEAFNNRFHGGHTYFPDHIRDLLTLAPYLNGGLFSQSRLDLMDYTFTISDARFQQTFDFLERYNFTIAEDSPLDQEVAVDPEMIGRVYENLVNVSTELDERGDAGIFYTPRTEIDLMCRLALVDYLANHIGAERKPVLYDAIFALEPEEQSSADDALNALDLWDQIDGLLREAAVLDPACGSGAFLVGMLYVLDNLQERASRYVAAPPEDSYTRKKRIIGKSLYGVDVMEWAAHIAELRLWLTLIVDAHFSLEDLHVRRDPLLPHLTFKVRYGDSLVQEIGGLNFGHRQATSGISPMMRRRLNTLKDEKIKFYYHDPSCKFSSREAAIQEEVNLFRAIIGERKLIVDRAIHALQNEIATQQMDLLQTSPTSSTVAPSNDERQKQLAEREREKSELDRVLSDLSDSHRVPFVWDIAFVEVLESENDGFDIVIGNPPYVRQEQISDPHLPRKEVTSENKKAYKQKLSATIYQDFPDFFAYKVRGVAGRPLDAKSDLYIYFYLHGLWLLNVRGSFCFITSNSWLDVGYGKDLQEFLLRSCRVQMIIDNQVKRSFASADVNTIIALFSAPVEKLNQEDILNHIARFVMFRVGFERVLDAAIFKEIEQAHERTGVPDLYRVYPIAQKKLLGEGMKQPGQDNMDEETEAETPRKRQRKGTSTTLVKEAQASYGGNKWGGKYLRAPDIYWTILEKGQGKLVRLGDIAEVRFGIKTGANEFFYLDEQKAAQWGIEEEFLRPVIKSPRECRSILIDPAALKFKLFMCHKSKEELQGTAALDYIEWGESQSFRYNPSVANRARWWDLGERRMPPIISPSSISELLRTFRNDGVFADKRLYEIYPNRPISVDQIMLATNAITSSLFLELGSRTGLGEGLLDLTVYELADCLIAIPEETDQVKTILREVSQRVILPLREELQHPSRRALDSIVFDVLNLTQGERDAVYEAVIGLVESRLKKASSLRQEKERGERLKAVEQTLGIWIGLPENFLEEVDSSYA